MMNPTLALIVTLFLWILLTFMSLIINYCILQCPSDTDAFQSGHLAEQNGRPETLRYQLLYHDGLITTV